MKRILTVLTAVVLLSACASGPAELVTIPSLGPATQENWEAGQTLYLAWNGARSGWTTTSSGLQFRREGKANPAGAQPTATDTVQVHYQGTFIDNREFDSSYSRGEPATFPLNRVIKGWTEGVALMREGETYQFVIPADLAYGPRWVGGEIPPNSVLKFKIELIDVNPAG